MLIRHLWQRREIRVNQSLLDWQVCDNAAAVSSAACDFIIAEANKAIADRGRFSIVLTGGRTPKKTYQMLARQQTDWSKWFVYIGDERCLPADDAERNSVLVEQELLRFAPLPIAQYFPIPSELGAQAAAENYAQKIASTLPFDLVLLGIGEDGHIASLFPGHSHPAGELVHAVHDSPKPPADRVSLSMGTLENSRHILFMVSGEGKAEAVRAWRRGDDLPVSRINPPQGTVLIDRDAMS